MLKTDLQTGPMRPACRTLSSVAGRDLDVSPGPRNDYVTPDLARCTRRESALTYSAERSTRGPGVVSRARRRRPPFPPDQPVHPRVRYFAVHDAVFPQRPFTHEPDLLQDAGRCRVARISLGLDSIQVQRVECPRQQGARGLGRVTLTPCRIVQAVAQRPAAVARVPSGQTAPADECAVRKTA